MPPRKKSRGGGRPSTRAVVKFIPPPSFSQITRNPEILRRVLQCLNASALAHLSRTCRELFVPCITELWSNMCDHPLKHLFALLPPNTTKSSSPQFGVLQKASLARWDLYRSMLRRIKLKKNLVMSDAVGALRMLAGFQGGGSLFPNLESIEFATSSDHIQISQLLLSPSLRDVQINSGDLTSQSAFAHLHCFLEWLPERSPSVTTLRIAKGLLHKGYLPCVVQCLCNLPRLEVVGVEDVGLTHDVIGVLAKCEGLRSLSISSWTSPEPADNINMNSKRIPDVCDQTSFTSLRTLHLAASMLFCTALIKTCGLQLEFLHLDCRLPATDAVDAWIAALTESCPLHDLSILLRNADLPDTCWDSLRGVEVFDLRTFTFSCSRPQKFFAFTDMDLERIADCWPNLEALTLTVRPPSVSPEDEESEPIHEPTLAALVPLAARCRSLRRLELGMLHKSEVDEVDVHFHSESLVELKLKDISFPPPLLADFLGAIWPNAKVQGYSRSSEVNRVLESVRYARRYDRGEVPLKV